MNHSNNIHKTLQQTGHYLQDFFALTNQYIFRVFRDDIMPKGFNFNCEKFDAPFSDQVISTQDL
jgi:hypothetical protein